MRSALISVVLLLACGAPGLPEADAGAIEDAGAPDAGVQVDAGQPDAGLPDAGSPDAGQRDAGIPDAGLEVHDAGTTVLVYPFNRVHSPMTADVVAHLRAIAALSTTRHEDAFSKVGDSNTVSTNFLNCFAGANVDLAGRSELQPTLTHFLTSFNRTSLAATVGWSAGAALAGTPSPLQQELDAMQPRYATVMFGTNDVGSQNPQAYGRNLFTIIDTLAMQGVVPVLSSIPRRDDSTTAQAWVPRYNLVARGVAQARKIPFVDLNQLLEGVTAHGLGGDGVHLNAYFPAAGARACVFTPGGLAFGQNVRNLATLEALSRSWAALTTATATDLTAERRSGSGQHTDEIAITSLPFVDVRDTRVDGESRISRYDGCASAADESGNEVLYRFELTTTTNVRIFVVSLGSSDIDVHLLSGADSGAQCIARNDSTITRQLAAGTYWLSLDTYVGMSGPLPGEYLVAVLAE